MGKDWILLSNLFLYKKDFVVPDFLFFLVLSTDST